MNVSGYLDSKRRVIDRTLLEYLSEVKGPSLELSVAMRYSVKVGGKRLRPILMLAIAEMFNEPKRKVLDAACAVEYIHTSTLILDDLPCMDNSDMRRGSLSVHRKFGEATAILASYSLVVLAFELLVGNAQMISQEVRLAFETTKIMSRAIGVRGLCAGQYSDLKIGSKKINIEALSYIHQHKTADLFEACCKIAGYLLAADSSQLQALGNYGRYIGLAFQAYDDILSINKTDAQLGKRTNKDKDSLNIVNLFGPAKAKGLLEIYAKKAKSHLAIFGVRGKILGGILEYAIHREK